jgi:hypothetical protein
MGLLDGLFSAPRRRRNTKKARLARKVRAYKKLEKKYNSPKAKRDRAIDAAIAAIDKKTETLRAKI